MLFFLVLATAPPASFEALPSPFPPNSIFSTEAAGYMLLGTFEANGRSWEIQNPDPTRLGTITRTRNWKCFGFAAAEDDGTPSPMVSNPFYVTKDNKIVYTASFTTPDITVPGGPGDVEGPYDLTIVVQLYTLLSPEELTQVPRWARVTHTMEELGQLYRSDPTAYDAGPGRQMAEMELHFCTDEAKIEYAAALREQFDPTH
jgi:hypothetical protein